MSYWEYGRKVAYKTAVLLGLPIDEMDVDRILRRIEPPAPTDPIYSDELDTYTPAQIAKGLRDALDDSKRGRVVVEESLARRIADWLDAPAPTQAESYDAPTGPGWWWAWCALQGWGVVEVVEREIRHKRGDHPVLRVLHMGTDEELLPDDFDRWIPLQPPGTTTPDVQAQVDALQAEVDRWRGTAANQMIQEAVAAEREACAKVAEAVRKSADDALKAGWYDAGTSITSITAARIRDEIRARSAQEKGEGDGTA
jgi:hypothetical protein